MTRRATFAFDAETIERIKRLAAHWGVSQAEAVRRALERADHEVVRRNETVAQELAEYHAGGGLARETVEAYLKEVAAGRDSWRE